MLKKRQNKPRTIADYRGAGKWCFAIVLNRACDNYKNNSHLFSESLLVFEQTNRKDWFDEDIRTLIEKTDTELPADSGKHKLVPNTPANRRLNDVRNYFSHFYHKDRVLQFMPDDPLRVIMEAAYIKAKEHVYGRQIKETDIPEKKLFTEDNVITPAGVVLLASFFVERRILSRLMGYIGEFQKTEGEYNLTRQIFMTYCLRDSYSIAARDPKDLLFRNIMGYLSRVPSAYFQHYEEQCVKNKESERKTDKFILFALQYLEEIALKDAGEYQISVGRMQVVREKAKATEDNNEQYRPQPNQGKVKVRFGADHKELRYYLNHHTAILRVAKKKAGAFDCKIGVHDLKYLILLCLQGKAEEGIDAIYRYLEAMQKPADVAKNGPSGAFYKGLPEFVLKENDLITEDRENTLNKRMEYIREKWGKKKKNELSKELHKKARDILRYLNWHLQRPLSTRAYNYFLSLLMEKDFEKFNERLAELKRTERLSLDEYNKLHGCTRLDVLHEKVCNFTLAELTYLEKTNPDKLREFIGIDRTADERAPDYNQKVKEFIKEPMVYKGYLREQFFVDKTIPKGQKQKSFAKLVEEQLSNNPDVPLGNDYYHIPKLDRFDKSNAVLYETLAQDRLCVLMARQCFEQINANLRACGQELAWKQDGGKDYIYLTMTYAPSTVQKQAPQAGGFGERLHIPNSSDHRFTIRFDGKHYTKLYVMDDAAFLGGLMYYFFAGKSEIDYHLLYSDGINNYTELQRQGVIALMKLEEQIIRQKKLNMNVPYLGFRRIMAQSGYSHGVQKSLAQVRNALQHYQLGVKPNKKSKGYVGFTRDDFKQFAALIEREGLITKMEKDGLIKRAAWDLLSKTVTGA